MPSCNRRVSCPDAALPNDRQGGGGLSILPEILPGEKEGRHRCDNHRRLCCGERAGRDAVSHAEQGRGRRHEPRARGQGRQRPSSLQRRVDARTYFLAHSAGEARRQRLTCEPAPLIAPRGRGSGRGTDDSATGDHASGRTRHHNLILVNECPLCPCPRKHTAMPM